MDRRKKKAPVSPGGPAGCMAPGTVFRECEGCPEMVVVPAGTFVMGSDGPDSSEREKPIHPVTISRPFAVGRYPVTQEEYTALVGTNPSFFVGSRNPVENVNWYDAQAYIRLLNEKVRLLEQGTGVEAGPYRLLSEAEWEYAARAGTTTQYWWGDDVGVGKANCSECGNPWEKKTVPVGSFPPNAFGIHEMSGNVWEWVEDCWGANYRKATGDGSASLAGDCDWRVVRGGSWLNNAWYLRSACRNGDGIHGKNNYSGFRLARTLVAP
ncbi:MAG: formylglycine-generating enzyme family protein [Alphaproteobacteria bacterium]